MRSRELPAAVPFLVGWSALAYLATLPVSARAETGDAEPYADETAAAVTVASPGESSVPADAVRPAPNAESIDPQVLVERAIRAREAGRDREALPLLQQAFARAPTPRTTAQLGLCEQALGLWIEAETHLRQALDATSDRWVRQRRAVLRAALASVEEQLGTLEVIDGVSGAELRIGGRSIGTLPMEGPATVVVGRATLEVLAAGYVPYTVELTVRPGELTRQSVTLIELPPPPPTPAEVARAATFEPVPSTPSVEREPLRKKWWFWTLLGAVVVGGTTGAILAATHDPGVQSPVSGTSGVAQALVVGR